MDLPSFATSTFSIPKEYICNPWTDRADRIIILTKACWLSSWTTLKQCPDFSPHSSLSPEEVQAGLLLGHDFGDSWVRVLVQSIPKHADSQLAFSLMRARNSQNFDKTSLSYPQLLHYVSHTNYKNLWKQQFKKYLGDKKRRGRDRKKEVPTRNADTVLKEILLRFYGCPVINLEDGTSSEKSHYVSHQNILPAECILETSDALILLYPLPHVTTLKEYITFSPNVFSGVLNKALFIVFQLIHALRDTHDRALILGNVMLQDIFISHDLFIQVVPDIKSNIFLMPIEETSETIYRSPIDGSLASMSRRWILGDLSNYDYLMHLNSVAGRRFGNPSCHFVLPWVSDLSHRSSIVWRDLKISKFRLNKGDRQLDLTYEQASSQAPHHVTDVLSEITYYVYLARRTPQRVLCRYVRPQWVPAEYPASLQRLYTWTPDECIPEFYSDPAIFKSIHEDLCDLELPPWAPTPEQFIIAHREQLESRKVSERLHHWIDLTFGYKLAGQPAVKAKNVCLRLANAHTDLSTSGVVQVFSYPHPRRQPSLLNFDKQPPKIRKQQSQNVEELHSSDGDDNDDEGDLKASPLTFHRFLSISRTSLLAPFQSSPDDAITKSSVASSTGTRSSSSPRSSSENPLALLETVESAFTFHMKTFGEKPPDSVSEVTGAKIKQLVASRRLQEMQMLGCIITEIFQLSHTRIHNTSTIEDRVEVCRRQLTSDSLPHCVRPSLKLLLNTYPPITDAGLPPPSAHQLLQPLLSSFNIPFPAFMAPLYTAVCKLKSLGEEPARAQMFSKDIAGTLSAKNVDIVHTYVKDLLLDVDTTEMTVNLLLDKTLSYLGVAKSNKFFLDTLIILFERTPPLLCLYQRRFLLTLMIRFGLKTFLNFFIIPVVEATGCAGPRSAGDAGACEEEESSPETEENRGVAEACAEMGVFVFDREDTPSDGESLQNLIEHLTGTDDDDECDISTGSGSIHIIRSPPIPVGPQGNWRDHVTTIDCEVGSKNSDTSNIQQQTCGTFDELSAVPTSTIVTDVSADSTNLHVVAADSIIWLARRLGPVLTAKHITRNLLKMLTLCYSGASAMSPVAETSEATEKISVSKHKITGDENAEKVLTCLTELVHLYGEQLILVQYLPFMADIVAISKNKLTHSVEGGVVAALVLLQQVAPLLSDAALMDNLQDVILNDILHKLVRLMVSSRLAFPSGCAGRLALATKLLDTLYFLAVHIGADMTRAHLAVPSLQRYFLAFDKAVGLRLEFDEGERETAADDLKRVFSPSLAHSAYLAFLRLLGEASMKTAIVNHDLVRRLCLLHEKQTCETDSKNRGNLGGHYLTDFFTSGESAEEETCSTSFGRSAALVGNKIEIPQDDLLEGPVTVLETSAAKDPTRHIRGNWLAYWEHEIGRSDKDVRFNFKQIKLQTFSGHTHAVRCLDVLDNENSLVSGSRDKTVKLWSLRSQGDGSTITPCQFTYNGHRKSLIGLAYLPEIRLVASSDSTLHLWDPSSGAPVAVIDGKNHCSSLKALGTLLLTGTNDATVRLVDARSVTSVAELKVCWSPGGLVRCLAVSPEGSWVAAGQSSGYITVLDLRTKLVMAYWKAHEGEVLQLVAVEKNVLLSSSIDQALSLWTVSDGKLKAHLKGPTEPVHCMRSHGNELISGTTANRIGVHTGIDAHAGFTSTKLRSDTFKGVLTSMAVLPLNMQLLLGADNGHITLLC